MTPEPNKPIPCEALNLTAMLRPYLSLLATAMGLVFAFVVLTCPVAEPTRDQERRTSAFAGVGCNGCGPRGKPPSTKATTPEVCEMRASNQTKAGSLPNPKRNGVPNE